MTNTPKTDAELREDLRVAEEAYSRSQTYYNAVAIQKAQKQLDVRVADRRKALRVVQGGAGSHDFSDIEVMGQALAEIQSTIGKLKLERDIPGVLLHCYNVSSHALKSVERENEG